MIANKVVLAIILVESSKGDAWITYLRIHSFMQRYVELILAESWFGWKCKNHRISKVSTALQFFLSLHGHIEVLTNGNVYQ